MVQNNQSKTPNPIELIQKINMLDYLFLPEDKENIIVLYDFVLKAISEVKPIPEMKKLSDDFTKAHNEIREKKSKDIKNNSDVEESMEKLKNIFEQFKNTKELMDDLLQTFVINILEPIQKIFYDIFGANYNGRGPIFKNLDIENLCLEMRKIIEMTEKNDICNKFISSIDEMKEIEKKESINIFDMMNLLVCQNCKKTEEEHKVCNFFISSENDFEKKICVWNMWM